MYMFKTMKRILRWLGRVIKRQKPNYPKHLYDKTRRDFIDKLNKK